MQEIPMLDGSDETLVPEKVPIDLASCAIRATTIMKTVLITLIILHSPGIRWFWHTPNINHHVDCGFIQTAQLDYTWIAIHSTQLSGFLV